MQKRYEKTVDWLKQSLTRLNNLKITNGSVEGHVNSILLTSKEVTFADEIPPTRNRESSQSDMTADNKLLEQVMSALNTIKGKGVLMTNSQDKWKPRNDPLPSLDQDLQQYKAQIEEQKA